MAPRQPAALMEELGEEILLRLPPDEPKFLFRAAIVCKAWRRLVSSARFRRRFCERHRTAPMLGYFSCGHGFTAVTKSSFSFSRLSDDILTSRDTLWRPVDALHGRILFYYDRICKTSLELMVWNAMAGKVRRLPRIRPLGYRWSAALACTAAGCDHLDCGTGGDDDSPFQVVIVLIVIGPSSQPSRGLTMVYSSEHDAWSYPVCVQLQYPRDQGTMILRGPAARAQNALYFVCNNYLSGKKRSATILEYDLGKRQLSLVTLPSACKDDWDVAPVTTEDGVLGLVAGAVDGKLYIWSKMTDGGGLDDGGGEAGSWSQYPKAIELGTVLPATALSPSVVPTVSSVGVVFLATFVGCFGVDLKSGQARNLPRGLDIVPFVTFCTPRLRPPVLTSFFLNKNVN